MPFLLRSTPLFFLTCLFILTVNGLNAQTSFQLTGAISDGSTKSVLPGAACLLLSSDSGVVKAVQSNEQGAFVLGGIASGRYILKVQFLGYETVFRNILVDNQNVNIGEIALMEATTNLKEVKIEGRIPPVRQLNDTTQFNATGFKTNRDASAEDLITKMPGITVQDGKVNAQGEEVRKVLVDNKPFFGDDPSAALKNIPAELIDKIQVFDQASDQARFTGFNDGNTTKTMNIVTKAGMNNGNFGKAYAGAGTDDRYKAGFTFNNFKGNRRLSVLGQSNNINEQNFAISDLVGAFNTGSSGGGRRGGGMAGGGGGGGGGFNQPGQNFLVNSKRGIVNTNAIGINFSDNPTKNVELSGSYFFNRSANQSVQSTNRRYVLSGDTNLTYSEQSTTDNINTNHRFNLRLNWNLDSTNSILYTPRFTIQQNDGTTNTFGVNAIRGLTETSTENLYQANQQSFTLNNELLLRHKFARKGRTISLNTNFGNSGTSSASTQNATNRSFGKLPGTDSLRQKSDLEKSGWSTQNTLTYTEPLHAHGQLSVNYTFNYAVSDNDKETRQKPALATEYSRLDSSLSNRFESKTPIQAAGVGYSFSDSKSNFNINLNAQQSQLKNDRTFPTKLHVDRTFQNILPTAMWRYSISEKKNFRLGYRTSANAPTIDQLQDVVNNSNPLQLSCGNSKLRQDYQHNVFFRYMSTHEKTNASFFIMAGATITRHYIGSSATIAGNDTSINGVALARGSQFTQPANMDGYMNLRSFLSYGLPVNPLKTNINLNANANFTRTPGRVNGKENLANSPTLGAGISLTSNISKAVDFNLGYNSSYTSVRNTLNTTQNNSYFTQIISGKLNLTFWERLVLNGEYNQNIYTGLSEGFNTNFALLNLGLGYKFLKNKQGELRATVFDLLNQNTNVSRTITETYTEDVRTNNLTRYFMLTFTYTLRAFKTPERQDGPPFPGMMRPGMGPPPGGFAPPGGGM